MSDEAEPGRITGELVAAIDKLQRVSEGLRNAVTGQALSRLVERLRENRFSLAVLGQFKRGKSTLINAVLGENLLPTAVIPLTSIVTVISYGPEPRCLVRFVTGKVKEIPIEGLELYATERSNPENEKGVDEIEIRYPSPYLGDGIRIVDTPGVGSVYRHNTEAARGFLPNADAALFVLSVDPPISQDELDFLASVREYATKVFFILNKIDYFGPDELRESTVFIRDILQKTLGDQPVRLYPLSARLGLEGKLEGDQEKVASSRLPELEESLRSFLRTDKEKVLLATVAGGALKACDDLELSLNLERQAIMAPARELKQKIEHLNRKLEEALLDRQDMMRILQGEARRLMGILDEDLEVFKEEASRQICAELSSHLEKTGTPARDMQREAESFVRQAIEGTFDDWVPGENGRMSAAYEGTARRFTAKADDLIRSIKKVAADLFSLDVRTWDEAETITGDSDLYYVVGDPEPFLPMPDRSTFLFLMPRAWALKVLLNDMKRRVWIEVDRNCGRVRHDMLDRIDRSLRDLRFSLDEGITAAVAGIREAISLAQSHRAGGQAGIEARLNELSRWAEEVAGARRELTQVRQMEGSGPRPTSPATPAQPRVLEALQE